jgi:hypothetical protein
VGRSCRCEWWDARRRGVLQTAVSAQPSVRSASRAGHRAASCSASCACNRFTSREACCAALELRLLRLLRHTDEFCKMYHCVLPQCTNLFCLKGTPSWRAANAMDVPPSSGFSRLRDLNALVRYRFLQLSVLRMAVWIAECLFFSPCRLHGRRLRPFDGWLYRWLSSRLCSGLCSGRCERHLSPPSLASCSGSCAGSCAAGCKSSCKLC